MVIVIAFRHRSPFTDGMRERRGEFVIDVLEFLPRQPSAMRVRIETEPILVRCLGKQPFFVEIINLAEET